MENVIKKNKFLVISILIIILLSFSFLYQLHTKRQIIENDNKIIVENNCKVALELNRLLLKEDYESNKKEVENLIEILYSTSFEASGYQIKDRYYLDVFNNLNYFEEYAYEINMMLIDSQISKLEVEFIKEKDQEIVEMLSSSVD